MVYKFGDKINHEGREWIIIHSLDLYGTYKIMNSDGSHLYVSDDDIELIKDPLSEAIISLLDCEPLILHITMEVIILQRNLMKRNPNYSQY